MHCDVFDDDSSWEDESGDGWSDVDSETSEKTPAKKTSKEDDESCRINQAQRAHRLREIAEVHLCHLDTSITYSLLKEIEGCSTKISSDTAASFCYA